MFTVQVDAFHNLLQFNFLFEREIKNAVHIISKNKKKTYNVVQPFKKSNYVSFF